MKKILLWLPVLMVFLCGSAFDYVCEWNSLMAKKFNVLYAGGVTYLEIGGIASSAGGVKKIVQVSNGDSIEILVYWTVATRFSKYQAGEFDYRFIIDDNVNEVFFGEKKVSIWKRDLGQKTGSKLWKKGN